MEQFLMPEEWNINDLFNGKYLIPIYQRPYNWGENEIRQLLKDLTESYSLFVDSQSETSSIKNEEMLLFTGTLFVKMNKNVKNAYTEYDIVDGQQRTTTFTLILMVLLNKLNQIGSNDDSVKEIKNYLWKKEGRKNNKDTRVLTLGNIDRSIMIELFDLLFAEKDIVTFAKTKLEEEINPVEKNLLNNTVIISDFFERFSNEEEYYNFFDYIKNNVRFIAIKVQTNLVRLFGIFESINSKGKPLEEIDLIKSYIFQNINEVDYDEYLNKWGKLITKTNDNLMDYLIVYVRANVSYYRNSIKLNNFKTLVENMFPDYYSTTNIDETLKAFIDDLLDNVTYYRMLSDFSLLESNHLSNKAVAVLAMNNAADYNHTKALYFKLLNLRDKNNLSLEEFERLVEYAFRFILTFQSISSRESKQTLNAFVAVQNEIYKEIPKCNSGIDLSDKRFDSIINIFNKRIHDDNINDETLRNGIKSAITYRRNKKVAKVLLSYIEFFDSQKIDYSKLSLILKLGSKIHLDHILPQNPKTDDNNFKYYVHDNNVILKDGQDFINNPTTNVVNKDEFYDNFLHVIGNLRLLWGNDNIKKSNNVIEIKEYDDSFNSYHQIVERTKNVINDILDTKLLLSSDDIGEISIFTKNENSEIIGFRDDIDFQNNLPISYSLLGEEYNLDKYNYSELLTSVSSVLYELAKEQFNALAQEKYSPMESDRIYISCDKDDLRKPIMLDSNVFIEKNLSSSYIVKFVYLIMKNIGLDEQDLRITIMEK